MAFDYHTLKSLRKNHPAWRLLVADHAPLIASFLHRAFIVPNHRSLSRAELASALEDFLFVLRENEGEDAFPRTAEAYLDDWASDDKGWLRKFYPKASDEVHYDLMPWVEKALFWLEGLVSRAFIGTESRLMTIFELLRQMVRGSEEDAENRIAALEQEKARIEAELERARAGQMDVLGDTALKDRFFQVQKTARELLSDFREVEYNFRRLDRKTREQIALWEGSKGDLLEDFFGERDVIAESDQGKSFNSFWDLLMSPARQEELSGLLHRVFELDAVQELAPDLRLKRVHYDWLEAGEHTQRTVAKLSGQLRRYLDDQAFLENKRIMQVIQSIETQGVRVKDEPPGNDFISIDLPAPSVSLPMERPMYTFPIKPVINETVSLGDGSDIPSEMLTAGVFVDKLKLKGVIRSHLQSRDQVSLGDILEDHPLEKGLAELVAYLSIAGEDEKAVFDENETQHALWTDSRGRSLRAEFNKVIFNR
ncbi:MAG: DUF3375 domain-containing protein [Desulfobacter sp.]|nr:MAG: DUF3375 domain-containing protein [Desulfobacter sp.]